MHTELTQRIFDHIENGDVDKAVRASLRLSRQIRDHVNTALFLRELIDDQHEITRVLLDDTSHLKEEAQKFILKHSLDRWLKCRTVPFSMTGNDEDLENNNVVVTSAGELLEEIRQLELSIADKRVPSNTVTVRKDDALAAHQAALAKVADRDTFSSCGGLIHTTSG